MDATTKPEAATPTPESTPVVRDANGRWVKGTCPNPGGRKPDSFVRRETLALFSELLAKPDIRKLMVERVERELKSDNTPTFTLRVLAYVLGEPKQNVVVDVMARAREICNVTGLPLDKLLAEAQDIEAMVSKTEAA